MNKKKKETENEILASYSLSSLGLHSTLCDQLQEGKEIAMEEQIMQLCDMAKRGAEAAVRLDGEFDEALCIDALDRLKKSSITRQLLVSTQVVRHLQPLTKHPRKKIQDFACDLIVVWRNMFLEQISYADSDKIEPANTETAKTEKIDKRTLETVHKILNAETFKVQKVDQNGTPSSKKVIRLESAMTEKTHSVENIKVENVACGIVPPKLICMIKCNDYLRDSIRGKLHKSLSKVSSEAGEEIRDEVNSCDLIRLAISLECSMFEKWGRYNGTHKIKYRCALFNLEDQRNPDFRRKVVLGHVKPEMVVNMSAQEMASDIMQCWYQHVEEKRREASMALIERRRHKSVFQSTIFKCGRCGQCNTYYDYNRRANVNTKHVTCLNCNQHWRSVSIDGGHLAIP